MARMEWGFLEYAGGRLGHQRCSVRETCRVKGRPLESKSAARSFKVLCGWAVVKAKTGAVSAAGGWAGQRHDQPEIGENRELRGGLAASRGR
jgi:hypothetical protein